MEMNPLLQWSSLDVANFSEIFSSSTGFWSTTIFLDGISSPGGDGTETCFAPMSELFMLTSGSLLVPILVDRLAVLMVEYLFADEESIKIS